MKLEYIRLINFRQYFGEQQADISTFNDLNVTVFHGLNGAGKTSLFAAINWCLYEAGTDNIGQLVSKEAVALADEGATIPCVVTVIFIHKGNRYIAERVIEFKKVGNKPQKSNAIFTLTRVKKSGDSETIPNPIGVMNSILPANVRPYFFFDGEKMDDLTKAGNTEVEQAVRNIMRLPTLERAQTHLQETADEYRREIKKKGSHELEVLIAREEEIRKRKDQLQKRREEVREGIRLSRQFITDLQNKLRELEAAKELQKRRDSIQSSLERLERSEEDALKAIQKFANRSYTSLLSEVSKRSLAILNEKREKGEIPSGIREQFIKDLIERGICVCGRSFVDDDEAYQHLTALLKRTSTSKLETEVQRLSGSIFSLSNNTETWLETLNDRCKDIASIKEDCARLYGELDDIKRQLIGTSIDEILELEKQNSKFQRQLENSLSEFGRIENELESIEVQLKELLKKRQDAEKKEKEIALLIRKESLAQRAADAVAKIKDEFFEKTRQEIEVATKEVFSKLAWKQDHFQDVQLDQDFKLEVIDRWGTPTRKELSAGERQILSLAFITAMSRLSGEEAPLVMDTPFGRLSGNHLVTVAENLPGLTPQLVLFVTDREWSEASQTRLEPRSGAQYNLRFDEKTGCTDIVEVSYE